ncbi:hypothetical protein [Rhizobium sp. BK602]|uniref:hypothetical protein n=1 Tax=Rhizobium sp. BK602 TaxID=2586986 RepID=UPI001613F8F0|nr:hypothetical protein [Rhizobium sp. BK602]MBB3609906.1 hypothetical protein [Rhizobium sp. BK602]
MILALAIEFFSINGAGDHPKIPTAATMRANAKIGASSQRASYTLFGSALSLECLFLIMDSSLTGITTALVFWLQRPTDRHCYMVSAGVPRGAETASGGACAVGPASTSYAGWTATALTNIKMIQAKSKN